MSVRAFIPAAGLGTRLAPITDTIPKTLIPVLGRPVLDYVLDKVLELPVDRIGINLHHLPDGVREWILTCGFGDMTEFFPEEPLLGTGGALYNARDFLQKGTFLVYNGDVISNIDMVSFHEFHAQRRNLVTLAVHAGGPDAHVGVDDTGLLVSVGGKGRPEQARRSVTFTGIALYEPGFLKYLPGGVSHVTDSWLAALQERERIGVYDVSDSEWHDMGTLDQYAERIAYELSKRGDTRFIGNNVYVPIDCRMEGMVVVESDSKIGMGVELSDVVVLPGGVVTGGEKLRKCLVAGKERIPFKLGRRERPAAKEPVKVGGSNRIYVRLQLADDISGFLLKSTPDDPDFDRQVEFTHFFTRHHAPVPRLLSSDLRRRRAIFEYLGEKDLYTWVKAKPDPAETLDTYKRVLDLLVRFQQVRPLGCALLKERVFDLEALLWESRYFMDRFVKGALNLFPENEGELRDEFRRLAEKTASYPRRVMHRDFQSCNVMLFELNIYFIDYQGARMGPPAYDAVSLIRDPYCPLPEADEETLREHYIAEFLRHDRYNESQFRESFLYCGLQRHMQALGAFGYLSRVKGKSWFEQHIPRGVSLLGREAEAAKEEFPALWKLVQSFPR